MGALFYRSARFVANRIRPLCIRQVVLDRQRVDLAGDGGLILACTHLSHLEPVFVSGVVRRHVRWMARIEFYRSRWAAAALHRGGAFPVDRFEHPFPAVRAAIRLVEAGQVIGMFPEGGVVHGCEAVIRGAPIKQGACTIAIATRTPVIPVVVLGTETLNRLRPWLPIRSGRVWIAFGHQVLPPPRGRSRRADRAEMAPRLRDEFVRTYRHLLERAGLRDEDVP